MSRPLHLNFLPVLLTAVSIPSFANEHTLDTTPFSGGRQFHLVRALPLDASFYQPPTSDLVTAGIPEKYGHEEWAAVVLTNEFHQHVGIYTILGAKMGVRARELLEARPRSVNVTAQTGTAPPHSCLVDGLQVALGSTLAQNLIHVPESDTPRTAAVFEYQGKKVRLCLKPKIQQTISNIISNAISSHGNLTPAYFTEIESASYRIWAEFDRSVIFDEEILHNR